MTKRFTATDKWVDPWFCSLAPDHKLFWIYLCDNCDHAGIWKVNWPLVKFHIGDYNFDKTVFNGRIKYLNDELWFLEKFILFQQKIQDLSELNPNNKAHWGIIKILTSKGILSPIKAPIEGLGRGTGIGIGIGKVVKGGIVKGGKPTVDEIRAYCKERGNRINAQQFFDFYEAKAWMIGKNKMKDWRAAVRTWEIRDRESPKGKAPDQFFDTLIENKLGKIATSGMIAAVLREMPEPSWWRVDQFLKKRYPGGGNGFEEAMIIVKGGRDGSKRV